MLFGYILELNGFGPCTVEAFDGQRIKVRFAESGLPQIFAKPHLLANTYRRVLASGDNIKIGDERASIIEAVNPKVAGDPFGEPLNYRIMYAGKNMTDVVAETEFTLLSFQIDDDLFKRLKRGGDGIANSLARRRLKQNVSSITNQVGGLKAILSGRIELYPHQAFVASTVLTDPIRRYILADEVGLGKTVEACIVIHDLLINKPNARILVIAPGPLCRQWLAEIYISFGGQRFNLADLYEPNEVELSRWSKVICSTNLLIGELKDQALSMSWDMVIVDEVHNLIASEYLYDIVKILTKQTRDVLLLSAVPVKQKENELYRLLALLDANRYQQSNLHQEKFIELYNSQDLIGRRLRLLKSTLQDFQTDDEEVEISEIASRIKRLCEIDLISSDALIQRHNNKIQKVHSREEAYQIGVDVSRHVVEKYRLNSRIIRNRRERLIDKEQLNAVERSLERIIFEPHQLEIETRYEIKKLIHSASVPVEHREIRNIFARIIAQASISAQTLVNFLIDLNEANSAELNTVELETIKIFSGFNTANSQTVQKLLFQFLKKWFKPENIDTAIKLASLWRDNETANHRENQALEWIQAKISKNEKTLIFCGYPGLAEALLLHLETKFGDTTVKSFLTEMPDNQKEENVTAFRLNNDCLVLICDESGGEGRNFAFVDHLLHYDLPWQISTLEQRIGRLDRLGRSMPVVSSTIYAKGEWDSHLVEVYENGLGIYDKSISGLEFELRNIQETMTEAILIDMDFDSVVLNENISKNVLEQRALDDADALLDEASFQEISSNQIRIQMNSNLEERLEDSFVDYFRRLSGNQAAVRVSSQGPNNVCTIRPDNLPVGEVAIQDRDQDGTYGVRRGTFIRSHARQNRNLNFFCWGNPLFDALNVSIDKRLTNRTYAATLSHRGLPLIGVWEIVAELHLENEDQIIDLGIATQIQSALNPRPIRVLFDSNLQDLGQHKQTIMKLLDPTSTNPFFLGDGASSFQDLNQHQIISVAEQLNMNFDNTLSKITSSIITKIEAFAKDAIHDQVQKAITASEYRLSRIDNSSEYEEEKLAEKAFQKAINNHSLRLDSIGFCAINAEM